MRELRLGLGELGLLQLSRLETVRLGELSWFSFQEFAKFGACLRPSVPRVFLTFILLNCHHLREDFPGHLAPPSQPPMGLPQHQGHNDNYWISFSVDLDISFSFFFLSYSSTKISMG